MKSVRSRRSVLAALALAVGLAAAGQAGARPAVLPTLYFAYTLNCTFTLTDDSGKAVSSIAPGGYQVQVTTPGSFGGVDLSGTSDMTACKGAVDFHLTGPGVDLATTLDDGDGSYDIMQTTFKPSSTYVAVDGHQPSVARASFTTLASGTPTAPTTQGSSGGTTKSTTTTSSTSKQASGSTSTKLLGTLTGTVTAAGKATLRSGGRAIASLKAGRYTIVVTDQSRKSGFVIQQAHKAATTVSGGPYTGRKSLTVELKPGQWFFYPSAVGTKTFFIVVAS